MVKYKNLSDSSGVLAYEIGPDFIRVLFDSGDVYRYEYSGAGRSSVDTMKELAASGLGLNTFIDKNVKYKHSEIE